MSLMPPTSSVEEFHGPYGPFNVSERVLQKIWLEGAFSQSGLVDQWGRPIVVEFQGRWNRLQGPDFKGAELRVGDERVRGDVEVHFAQRDWKAHGHDLDPAYDEVVLHVLYHPARAGEEPARTLSRRELPRVSLLPLLWYSLEEYASDESIIDSTGVDLRPEVEKLLTLDLPERRRCLAERARLRWDLKLFFAGKRIERLGWEGACHQSALEAMGFARNRVPMLRVAERFPLSAFGEGGPSLEALWEAGGDRWRLSGCRPANHPRRRLGQYREWVRARGAWPTQWAQWAEPLAEAAARRQAEFGSQAARQEMGVSVLRKSALENLLAGAVAGAKADTLLCDALMPLLAERQGAELFELWFHWHAGNGPASCVDGLRLLQALQPRRIPMSNGWLQGMLGLRTGA